MTMADGDRKPVTYVPDAEDSVDDLYSKGCNMGINFKKYFDIPVNVTGPNYDKKKLNSFAEAKLTPAVRKNVEKSGYEKVRMGFDCVVRMTADVEGSARQPTDFECVF